jgi:hypothetical protein
MTYSFFAQTYASKRFCNFDMLINWKRGQIGCFWGHMGFNFDGFLIVEKNPSKLL